MVDVETETYCNTFCTGECATYHKFFSLIICCIIGENNIQTVILDDSGGV